MIPQINKILYATDLTKNSAYAFYFAVNMAREYKARIVILHCVPVIPPQVYFEAGLSAETVLEKAKSQEKEDNVADIKEGLREFCMKSESQIGPPCLDLVSDIIVKESHPVEEILNTADREECDMIILGSHGKGWLKQTFLGSVARSVIERTRKPIFLVPLPSGKAGIDWGTL
jgi:nucleotide-binding universal stress UspA family protein